MRRPWQGWPAWWSMHDAPDKALKTASGDSLARGLARVAVAMGMIAALVGAGHLAAWLGGSLSQRGLSTITMKTNAALCLTLVGVALILLVAPEAGSTRRWIARAFAALALLLGFLTLVENLSGWNFGTDQLLAVETPGAIDVVSPNRMGTPDSLGFTLLGLALLLLSRRNRRGVRTAQTLALAVCLVGLLPTIGLLYRAQEFYGIARYTAIAWPTAVVFVLLGVGLLCARPTEGLMAQVTADDPGGVSIRRLLPVLVILPMLLAWLHLIGERAGIFDASMAAAMTALTFIILCSALAYHAGRRASRSAQALRESEERLRLLGDNLPDSAVYQYVHETDGSVRFLYVSAGIERLNGVSVADVLREAGTLHRQIPPEYLARLVEAEARSKRELSDFDMEVPMRRPDGGVRWMRLCSRPRRLPEGRTVWDGVQTDITDHKQAEAALRESEEHYRSLFDNMLNGFAFCRMHFEENRPVDFTYLEVNRAFESLTGLKNVTGKSVSEVIPGLRATNPEMFEIYGRVALTGRPEQFETYVEPLGMWFLISVYSPQQEHFVAVFDVITERKRAEEQLRETRDYLEKLFGYANAPIICWDRRRAITRFNPAFERLTGYAADEVIGRDLSMLFPDETRDDSLAKIARALTERWEVVEIPIQRKDGETRVALWNSANVYAEDGTTVLATIAQGQDITERKRAEEALRQSEERFRTMANAIPQLAWIAQADGYIFWYNQRWYQYTATTPEQMEGWGWQSVHDPVELPKVLEQWKASIATGEPFEMTFPLRGADGVFRLFLTRGFPLKDAAGRVVQWFGTNTDVEEIKRAEEALRESEQRLKLSQQAAKIGAFDWNVQTGVNVWTPELEAMYGLVPGEFGRTQPAWEQLVHPEDRAAAVGWVDQAFKTGQPVEGEWRVVWRDGSVHWLIGRFQVFKDAEGKPLRLTGVNIDITERKLAEEELRRLKDELETRVEQRTAALTMANQELEAFTYSVSHDLRAPLRHVTGFIELLEKRTGAGLDPESRRYVRVISEAAQRMGKLIDDLLMLSRVGRVALVETEVDLGRVVEEVRQELAPEAAGRAMEWQIGPLPRVRGDATLLRTVLANLLSNAIKYSRNRDPARIEIGSETQHGEIVCYVKDNGAGFDMRFVDKLFGVFQRLHPPEQFEGSGIGLASVRRIVQRHGGRVWAQGEVDRGATFYFSLPNRSTDR